ncbi:M23 family metallopeptidase [Thermoflexus sp.]|uniref:M23 family metallopeptidase n=1 Tax=Thermoflexus sp. TaxID=1969742 RepID=UPI001764D41E|nr:M23 family metallopeptidase [Thermoflexus sp.]
MSAPSWKPSSRTGLNHPPSPAHPQDELLVDLYRFPLSIDHPADWQITPRDDGADRYGGVVIFSPMHGTTHPIQVVVGLYTVERDPNQNMSDWTTMYQQISSPFSEHEIQIIEKSSLIVSNKPAITVYGLSPMTSFRFVNIPHGRTVWFIWTNGYESLGEIYWRMIRSFKLSERTPYTLAEAFGSSFHPLSRPSKETSRSINITGVIPAPAGWRVPTSAGPTYTVNCGSPYHTGPAAYATDISMSVGTGVYAAQRGWVDFAGWDNTGYGNLIKISTDFIYSRVYTSYYAHLQSFVVSPGQEVAISQLIAYSGNTGNSTGPHLHFHTQSGSDAVDLRDLYVFNENSLYPNGVGVCGYMYR